MDIYNKLEYFFSEERMEKYLIICSNDRERAVKFYRDNVRFSSQLYSILSYFEIFLRNRVNNIMINYDKNWILNLHQINDKITKGIEKIYSSNKKTTDYYTKFFKIQDDLIGNAKHSLSEDRKPITNSYLISRLNFGFWTRLFNRVYEDEIWRKYLKRDFGVKTKRSLVENNLNTIRRLRNRIAHNECVLNLKYTPLEYYDFIINLAKNIDIRFSDWLEKTMSRDLFN